VPVRQATSATPWPGQLVHGSSPTTRPRPNHGHPRLPPSSSHSHATGNTVASQDSRMPSFPSLRRSEAHPSSKSSG
jgi:hypothetical protein